VKDAHYQWREKEEQADPLLMEGEPKSSFLLTSLIETIGKTIASLRFDLSRLLHHHLELCRRRLYLLCLAGLGRDLRGRKLH
jgi:hypothetical protein